jgi:hypothetical protein
MQKRHDEEEVESGCPSCVTLADRLAETEGQLRGARLALTVVKDALAVERASR